NRPEVQRIKLDDIDIDFAVEVEAGSTLPRNPEAIQEAVMQLVQMGLPPEFALLILESSLGIPGLRRFIDQMMQPPPEEQGQPAPGGAPGEVPLPAQGVPPEAQPFPSEQPQPQGGPFLATG
ncbi:MAG: hypothetical protein ACYS8L_10655, partial [Planctomycetota bacterium]